MLATQSILSDTAMTSVLAGEGYLHPQEAGRHRRSIQADLLLTALIDAFSILVIFLLMSFSSTGELLFLGKDTELPKAALSEVLERNPVVKIENGTMFVEDKEVAADGLIPALLDLRKQFAEMRPGEEYPGIVTVQADRRVKYEVLNQIVLAASAAGFGDIRFAVLAK
ncbi:MAG TPA: biopolymer transporter ExbD [Bdellovibrionales bacterium]|nr:biopolymer transporter ExbD [Bdellovibrionales bacterium]